MSDGSFIERLQQDVADRQPVDWAKLIEELQSGNVSHETLQDVSLVRLLDEIGVAHPKFQSGQFGDDGTSTLPVDHLHSAMRRCALSVRDIAAGLGQPDKPLYRQMERRGPGVEACVRRPQFERVDLALTAGRGWASRIVSALIPSPQPPSAHA